MTNSQMEEVSLRLAEEWFERSLLKTMSVSGSPEVQDMLKRQLIKSVKAAIHRGLKEYRQRESGDLKETTNG